MTTTQPKTPPSNGQTSDLLNTTSLTAASILDLRLDPSQLALTQGMPVLVDVQVGKPPRGQYWRLRVGDDFRASYNLLDAGKIGGEGMHLITPQIAALVPDQVRAYELRLGATQFGTPFFLPVPLPSPEGRSNRWHMSLAAGATLAEENWIRIAADLRAGAYTVIKAGGNLGDPRWPSETFDELLTVAFRGSVIDSKEHPLIRQLLGEI
ncbi:hypothetical protein [Acidocella sp.]|uniref:hypothetical protein n=1 Tax=Acidocella sp. TaxID=50710 RepID=UPI003D0884A7